MNKTLISGRLTKDPEIRYTQGSTPMCIANYTLAVDRRIKRPNEQSADFIPCVAFGKSAEFAEKYFKKGTKLIVTGRIQTSNYVNKDGQRVYKTEILVEEQEFAESKATAAQNTEQVPAQEQTYEQPTQAQAQPQQTYTAPTPSANSGQGIDSFVGVPDGVDTEMPFS